MTTSTTQPVYPIGPLSARLAICGEAPGDLEAAEGIPFVPWAPSGEKLMRLAYKSGLVRADMYLTNVVKEHPPYNDISPYFANGKFTDRGEDWRQELLNELAKVTSPVVLAVGAVAMMALTDERRPLHLMRGSPLINTELNKVIIPTLHPAGIMRTGQHMQYQLVEWDIRNALELAEAGGIDALPKRNYTIDPKVEQIEDWFERLAVAEEFAFDIETNGHELTHTSFSLSPLAAISIPLGKFSGAQQKVFRYRIGELLASPHSRKITQNGNYDTFFLRWYHDIAANLSTLDDAMVANSIMFPQLAPASSLDAATGKSLAMLTSLWGREVYYKDAGDKAKKAGDSLGYQLYSAKDSAVLHQCWNRLKAVLLADSNFKYTYDFTMARLPAIQAMQWNGFRVNHAGLEAERKSIAAELVVLKEALNRLAQPLLKAKLDPQLQELIDLEIERQVCRENKLDTKALTTKITKLRTTLRQWSANGPDGKPELGQWELSSNAPNKLCQYFYEWRGLPAYTKNRKGKTVSRTQTIDDKALTKLMRPTETRDAIEEAGIIQQIREREKLISTYIDIDYIEGRYYSSFNLRGTWTGRYSSSQLFFRYGSNQQNIPPRIRQHYLPDRVKYEGDENGR